MVSACLNSVKKLKTDVRVSGGGLCFVLSPNYLPLEGQVVLQKKCVVPTTVLLRLRERAG